MSFEQKESEPQPSKQDLPYFEQPEPQEERPYSDHPVVARGEEATIILGEN